MYAQKKPIENTQIVRERDRQRFRELIAVAGIGLPIGLFLLLFTWQNLEVMRLGHEATKLQKQKKEVENANKNLKLELDLLTSLSSVETRAASLGFEPTDPRMIVMIQPRSITGSSVSSAMDQSAPASNGHEGEGR